MLDCLIDPFIFEMDGKPGMLAYVVVFFGNSALYLYNLIVGTGVLVLIVRHINKKISAFQRMMVCILTVFETVLLVINIFTPIVFAVDANNVYSRLPFYYAYIIVAFYLLAYGLYVYLAGRRKDASLRYFPVWEFIIPIILGVTIQTLFYGLSAQPVSFAVAFCSIVICLQKEYLYVDKLTGVYNRYELDRIFKHYKKSKREKFAAIMLDMNNFKSINDDHSHKEGDEALKSMAAVLQSVIGSEGNIIRFAGDEFVIVMGAPDEDTVENTSKQIQDALAQHNATSGKPYVLSASVGGMIFDTDDPDYVIGRIDRLMYDAKAEYYRTHDRRGMCQRDGSFDTLS
jgi:diguanylate cyclase (GGDEF)-like protein